MKQYLLPDNKLWVKANLHCHSSLSYGACSPEELKRDHKERGYSVLAITDWGMITDLTAMNDEDFIILTGAEVGLGPPSDIYQATQFNHETMLDFHVCLIAKDPANTNIPCRESERYDVDDINRYVMRAKNAGFFVIHNHPDWSLAKPDDYARYRGCSAMEVFNSNTNEDSMIYYELYSRAGGRCICVGSDDDHAYDRRFRSFTMLGVDRLSYGEVIRALDSGAAYASTGPLIHSLYVEDGTVYVTCDPAAEIRFRTQGRHRDHFIAEDGQTLTQAHFTPYSCDGYVRVEVYAPDGKRAYTRAYYLDEFMK